MKQTLKKSLKYIVDIGFIGVMLWLTFRLLFKGQELGQILHDLSGASPPWIVLGAASVFGFVAGESCIILYILNAFSYYYIVNQFSQVIPRVLSHVIIPSM